MRTLFRLTAYARWSSRLALVVATLLSSPTSAELPLDASTISARPRAPRRLNSVLQPQRTPSTRTPALLPARAEPGRAVDEQGREVVIERYPNRAIKIQRSIKQDRNRNYVNDGPWTMFDPQGNVIAQGSFLDGERHGDWMKQLDTFGGAEMAFQSPFTSQGHFKHGQLDGSWTVVDSQQKIVGSWEFVDGKLHGAATLWYPTGKQSQEMHFAAGQPDGEATVWKPDGSIFAREFYREGKQLVPVVTWHDQQQKESEGWLLRDNFKIVANVDWWNGLVDISREDLPGEDLRVGNWTEWHANGNLRYRGEFKDGLPAGEHVWWHENGQRLLAGNYLDGERDGRWTKWHPNGHRQQEGQYLAGVKQGTWTEWAATGEVMDVRELVAEATPEALEGPVLGQPYSHVSLGSNSELLETETGQ